MRGIYGIKLMKLLKHQIEGVDFIRSLKSNCLIADEMGLGKSAQAICFAKKAKVRRILIICPASLRLNWQNEIMIWAKERAHIMSSQALSSKARYNIISYESLHKNKKRIAKRGFTLMILDECHFIKNPKAKRTKAVQYLRKHIKYMIGLSGTPIYSTPADLFCFFNLLNPISFPNYYQFVYRYCKVWRNRWGLQIKGVRKNKVEELKNHLNKYMIRRTKDEVLNLPDKIQTIIPVRINNMNEYLNLEKQPDYLILKNGYVKFKNKIEQLKQKAVEGKLDKIIGWTDNVLSQVEKLMIYVSHHKTADYIKSKFKSISDILDGRCSPKQKQNIINKFNKKGGLKLLIININAGIGINLTSCSTICFVELPWTVSELFQAIDRCHRIGQSKTVNVYYLVGKSTIEEIIMKILSKKLNYANKIVDGEDGNILNELIRRRLK